MNLATLFARRGQPGLEQLAQASNGVITVTYLQRLLYVLTRRPSLERAQLLIDLSNRLWPGEGLTLEGLTNPVHYMDARVEAEKQGKVHESLANRVRPRTSDSPGTAADPE